MSGSHTKQPPTPMLDSLMKAGLEKTDYKEKYLIMTKQYSRDIAKLYSALEDLYNSNCGMPKICKHPFTCNCASTRAAELIELFGD